MNLSQQTCEPCNHWVPPLKGEKLVQYQQQVSGEWEVLDEKKLVRNIKKKNFMEIITLVNQIAQIAEAEGHHPNLSIHDYNRLTVELYTHKINGLHENDFILAAKIDEALNG